MIEFKDICVWTGIVLFALMLPALYRVVVGPTAIDRIVAVNVIGTKTAVLLVVIGVIFDRVDMFVDFALAYALLNFIGSLAASRYLHKTPPSGGKAEPVTEIPPAAP
ncbi:MAG: pH regulation protein F [Verrucomicrobiae bacterium]|nr:pH regulation protein F [Verrucomicrobiae bacterium]MCP5539216.1 pH regulation protein F [Akkermansiaceae bacterium]MCP5549869.1 pH regulation protein F [Akkermansiaceae bacterium]